MGYMWIFSDNLILILLNVMIKENIFYMLNILKQMLNSENTIQTTAIILS